MLVFFTSSEGVTLTSCCLGFLSTSSPGLCCIIATNLQRSCFAWASCVGWWRGLHETLLFSSAHAEIAEGSDSDWPDGGDVDVRLSPEEEHFDVDPTVTTHKDTVKG